MFRHLKEKLIQGYEELEVAAGQRARVARPEKALVDLLYLTPGSDKPEYLRRLGLKNLDRLNLQSFIQLSEVTGSLKVRRAASLIAGYYRVVVGPSMEDSCTAFLDGTSLKSSS